MKHPDKRCDGCKKDVIYGARWACRQCDDFDLCTPCYMLGQHDKRHNFFRFDTNSSLGVAVPPRCESNSTLTSWGFYPEAKVVRGHNWEWKNQDVGTTGTITMIQDKPPASGRSVAEVEWGDGSRNIYWAGHKGKVGLKCRQPGRGFPYYRTHLQVCGKDFQESSSALPSTSRMPTQGDMVRIVVSADDLKRLQKDHGGWDPQMRQLIGKVGWVHRITDGGDVRVRYERRQLANSGRGNPRTKWTINPSALLRSWASNDDEHQRMTSQEESLSSVESSTQMHEVEMLESIQGFSYPSGNLATDSTDDVRELIQAASCGDASPVQRIASLQVVNEARDGAIPIHSAAKNGHCDVIQRLLASGARCNVTDASGYSALHHAIIGEHMDVVRLLVDKGGADVNMMTREGTYPLHLAVSRGLLEAVKFLLDRCANLSLQDNHGNTALHCSVGRPDSHPVTTLLCCHPSGHLMVAQINKEGLNPLHVAIKQSDERSVGIMLDHHPTLSGKQTQEGLYPLHLAAASSHDGIARLLLAEGCDVDVHSREGATPLYTACEEGAVGCVEVLVGVGANVNHVVADTSCIEVAMRSPPRSGNSPPPNPSWSQVWTVLGKHEMIGGCTTGLLISCYLAHHGASLPDEPDYPWMQCLAECHSASVGAVAPPRGGKDTSALPPDGEKDMIKLQEELERVKDELLCQICMDQNKNIVFVPCGHGCCEECKKKIFFCHFCKKDITQTVKTYP